MRTYSAGCFAGHLESRDGKEAVLTDCRRLWRWDGASSLSELAVLGTSRPGGCKFPVATPRHTLTEVIEVIQTTPQGEASIKGVAPWTQH